MVDCDWCNMKINGNPVKSKVKQKILYFCDDSCMKQFFEFESKYLTNDKFIAQRQVVVVDMV